MSKTKLQARIERIEQVLAEYRFSVEPLKSAVIRKEIARKIAGEIAPGPNRASPAISGFNAKGRTR